MDPKTKFRTSGIALALIISMASGCASHRAYGEDTSQPDQRGEIAKGAGEGALAGARVCSMPAAGGALTGGPIGFAVGGILSMACLPVGIAIGAVAGALNATNTPPGVDL
jgi:hypothetical protein